MSGEPSTWEIARNLSDLKKETRQGFEKLEAKIENLTYVPMMLYMSEQQSQNNRISELEEEKKWQRRQTIGAMITAIVSLAVTFLAVRGGFG